MSRARGAEARSAMRGCSRDSLFAYWSAYERCGAPHALLTCTPCAQRTAAAAARCGDGGARVAARAPAYSNLSAEEHAWFLEHAGARRGPPSGAISQ